MKLIIVRELILTIIGGFVSFIGLNFINGQVINPILSILIYWAGLLLLTYYVFKGKVLGFAIGSGVGTYFFFMNYAANYGIYLILMGVMP